MALEKLRHKLVLLSLFFALCMPLIPLWSMGGINLQYLEQNHASIFAQKDKGAEVATAYLIKKFMRPGYKSQIESLISEFDATELTILCQSIEALTQNDLGMKTIIGTLLLGASRTAFESLTPKYQRYCACVTLEKLITNAQKRKKGSLAAFLGVLTDKFFVDVIVSSPETKNLWDNAKQQVKNLITSLSDNELDTLLNSTVGEENQRKIMENRSYKPSEKKISPQLCPSSNPSITSTPQKSALIHTLTTAAAATMASGALGYAFFNWGDWSDIKKKKVFIPLLGGVAIAELFGQKTETGKIIISGGALTGMLLRFVLSKKEPKRSILPQINDPVHTALAAVGITSGFFTGLFDLTYKIIVDPIVNIFKQNILKLPPENGINPVAEFKKPKTIAKISCYLTRTITPVVFPYSAPLVAGAEYLGSCVRSTAFKIHDTYNYIFGKKLESVIK